MKRNTLFAASLLALGLLGGAATAATPVTSTPTTRPQRVELDVNGDGAIDRSEAAKSPRFAEHFDRIDKNHDGRISADERPQRGKHGRGKGRHGDIAALDSNGDGRLAREELAGKGRFEENFAAIDANRDGYLVRSELRAYHDKQRPLRQAEHAKRMDAEFAGADLNRDGKLSRVEVDGKMPRAAKGFAWMDDNKDGFLSRTEMEPSHHR
jgi:Ca2+-binding EF-hand superfamily protein